MNERKTNCAERRELEDRIGGLLRTLAKNSVSASELARHHEGDGAAAKFQALSAEYDADTIRLKILRECLELHKTHHNCGG